ncbi:flagellar hook-associated protein FlgL [uncultured Psychromonas sp.]|uniref:flagellar hook-associated protein FlgL n=1 Tax=uncultured Psychromonas sp. TaxID=173974 RepID=UPI00260EFD43|nr:flagellar hook-associated protein FlgL [uncultured Psychromonas sp.]
MRISSQMLFMRNTSSLMSQQSELSEQNLHMASQKRVIHGSDDPVAIATIQRLKQDISVGEQYIENGEMAESANELIDTALTQSTNILQRARELMVSGSNGIMNESNREAIAVELENLREELMGLANTKDGNSQYIFAGFEVDTQPFQKNEFGEVIYHGDSGERDYKIGSGVSIQGNDSGASVFMNIAEGNGTFVSEVGSANTGGGIISSGNVIDENAARDYLDQDYTIAITDGTDGPEYSVYGLKEKTVSGEADVRISSVDASISGTVEIQFSETSTPDEFYIIVNGQSSNPDVYDATDSNTQEININGTSIEIGGLPADGDSFELTQYITPTPYEDGQAITFNGIKTELKGGVVAEDSFTLRQSEEKDIFATLQSSIDALRIPGTDETASAARNSAFSNSLLQIDAAMDNVMSTQSSVGARLRTIDNQRESTLDFNLTAQSTLSSLEDLDMAAAISEYQEQYSMLEISQKTYVQLQQLSLFNLI